MAKMTLVFKDNSWAGVAHGFLLAPFQDNTPQTLRVEDDLIP